MNKKPKALKAVPREPSQHDARFVALILRTSPFEVFPHGSDSSEEGTDHLILTLMQEVDALAERLNDEDDDTEEFAAYRRRVLMCADVISGKQPAPRESMWAQMAQQYGRGRYLSHKAHLRREAARG